MNTKLTAEDIKRKERDEKQAADEQKRLTAATLE